MTGLSSASAVAANSNIDSTMLRITTIEIVFFMGLPSIIICTTAVVDRAFASSHHAIAMFSIASCEKFSRAISPEMVPSRIT
ncbi:MAG: hypothetical protein BWY81_00004 [Firmicutes bacterium ADurb.Bin467]|nr:MAG: hypothetical protein BWY81_00004 [Firmicutes bacterium ADurb.Bin467]